MQCIWMKTTQIRKVKRKWILSVLALCIFWVTSVHFSTKNIPSNLWSFTVNFTLNNCIYQIWRYFRAFKNYFELISFFEFNYKLKQARPGSSLNRLDQARPSVSICGKKKYSIKNVILLVPKGLGFGISRGLEKIRWKFNYTQASLLLKSKL